MGIKCGCKSTDATNKIGSSDYSDYSQNESGANLITKPDAPTGLVEDSSVRSPTILGITWTAP
jgi:hypothetical protein